MKPSRRQFLRSALTAPLGAGLAPWGARLLDARSLAPGQELFENPHIIRYDSNCFTINGRDTFVFSAAFHYPRCPRALWHDRLLKFQRAGFNTIETYVFWNYHEPEEGRADLGEFEDFVKLVKEMGFWMIARPGPYVCAEWERGGFPSWVAAKRFPLRSNHPESVRTSGHWFNQVMPIIQRHQVTVGGPIIMVQVENEYDFCREVPDAEKREYIRALAHMAWNAGIDVPLITCWTRQARENSDPDMARIMDTCNFYPRWNILKQVPSGLEKLRQEEPKCPLGVTELQGGWFSQFGQKLSIDQEGMTGTQLNLLTKTVMEQGVTYFSYYMGYGGTNFDWAAKTMTTTYDYAAPIREPGGLWEKYYAARGVGCSLPMLGPVLVRARKLEGVPQCTSNQVSVTERSSGSSAVVFVRENANAEQRFKMSFRDPASPTRRTISVPREGELVIGPREMKMLPVQVPIAGGKLRYSTADALGQGVLVDRHYLILYDEPGRLVEFAVDTEEEPRVEGDTLYHYWDAEYESVVVGIRVEKAEKILLVNTHLLVVIAPRELALRTWTGEFSARVVPGAEARTMSVPFIADSYLMAASGSSAKRIWAELDLLPGEHALTALLPPQPAKAYVDGVLTKFEYDRPWRAARLQLATPAPPAKSVTLTELRTWVERFDTAQGNWVKGPPRPLEELGPVPYGYVKYRAEFSYASEPKMFLSTFAEDSKKVFLNGRLVAEASNANRQAEFPLSTCARAGTNTLEIAYELFGSPNGGPNLGELKGIAEARLGAQPQGARPLDSWQIQRFPAAMRGREIDPDFSLGRASAAQFPAPPTSKDLVPAFAWCRAEFHLDRPAAGWSIPWKLTFEAERDALVYLNGKFVGRYVTVGPQKEFYLPEPYLAPPGKKNILTIVLAYADQAGYIRVLRVSPYEEYSVLRTRVEFEW